MSDTLRSKVCAYIVTDAKAVTALFKECHRAEQYATCVRDGVVDGMVKLQDALDAMAESGCRRCSDEAGAA